MVEYVSLNIFVSCLIAVLVAITIAVTHKNIKGKIWAISFLALFFVVLVYDAIFTYVGRNDFTAWLFDGHPYTPYFIYSILPLSICTLFFFLAEYRKKQKNIEAS